MGNPQQKWRAEGLNLDPIGLHWLTVNLNRNSAIEHDFTAQKRPGGKDRSSEQQTDSPT